MNNSLNQAYLNILSELTKLIDSSKYIVLGSMSTLSYTHKIGYEREMHDLDLIVDKSQINIIRNILLPKGYIETTFIHPRMPLYKFLLREAPDRYIRFYKSTNAIECHVTDFIFTNQLLIIDLYPNIKIKLPIKYLTKSVYGNVEFSTVNVNLLYLIKNFLNNTLGYFVHYKSLQRQNDLRKLEELIDTSEVENINNNLMLTILKIQLKLPIWLIRKNSNLTWR